MVDLQYWRQRIDEIDKEIIAKIAERFALCEQIGLLKQTEGMCAIKDQARETYLMDYYAEQSEQYGVNSQVIQNIFLLIIEESKRLQAGLGSAHQ